MSKHKNKIIAGIIVVISLTFVFWYGGDAPGLRGWKTEKEDDFTVVHINAAEVPEETVGDISVEEEAVSDRNENIPLRQDSTPVIESEKIPEDTQSSAEETPASAEIKQSDEEYSEEQGMVINEATGKDQYRTDPVPEGKPIPVEPENAIITDKELTCTLSVRCDAIFKNIGWLDAEKADIIPKDGVIYAEQNVTFYEGESVFNVLVREMKRSKIHMEFENTPIYNSAYIEGIANLYEFDCGELSGWMYKVNGWFPNYGCSRYQLKQGDRVEWVYSCDLGWDVGGQFSARNGR